MDPQIKSALLGGLGTASAIAVALWLKSGKKTESQQTPTHKSSVSLAAGLGQKKKLDLGMQEDEGFCALLGDVGGTNIRLVLATIYLHDKTKREVIKEANVASQTVASFEEAVKSFLKDFEGQDTFWPQAAVVGIAGPVENNVCEVTNCPHWPPVDGKAISQQCSIPNFTLINDFAAAGYGILNLQEKDYIRLTDQQPTEGGVKVVIGPGTGLGQGFLCKSDFSPYYEVFPCEGGHVCFSVRTKEDFELLEFATKFIEESDNIENQRGRGKINRVSIERLCAGPAVPLIYDFMRTKYPDLERTLEKEGINFNQMTSSTIIECAMKKKDPLCLKVVEKFTEILGVEVGNAALKTLPFGGVYLTGGVTAGIQDYLLHSETFLNAFYSKGRQEKKLRKIPIFIVKPENQLGLMGSEECARRIVTKMITEQNQAI